MTNSTDIRKSTRKRIHKKMHDKKSLCKTIDLKMKKTSHDMFDAGSLSLNKFIPPLFPFKPSVLKSKFSPLSYLFKPHSYTNLSTK